MCTPIPVRTQRLRTGSSIPDRITRAERDYLHALNLPGLIKPAGEPAMVDRLLAHRYIEQKLGGVVITGQGRGALRAYRETILGG